MDRLNWSWMLIYTLVIISTVIIGIFAVRIVINIIGGI